MTRYAFIAVALVLGGTLVAQEPAAHDPVAQRVEAVPEDSALVARMIDEGLHHSHVAADLEELLDDIGPRLSGSLEVRRANEWTRDKFLAYGADRATLEAWDFGQAWARGPATFFMLAPHHRELLGASWAWSPGTKGPIAGPVVLMDARSPREFDQRFAGKLKGAWVMLGAAQPILNPDAPHTPAASAWADSVRRTLGPRAPADVEFMNERLYTIADEHPAGIIRDGGKPFGLLSMSGSPIAVAPVPQVVIANEDYSQFQRLIARGVPVRFEANVSNNLTHDRVQQFNTVAEIRGSELPDQVVLLGAHLDSWDLATGGTDNGAGVIAVLEAARILAASGAHPKRTIRFVLFTGEEEGLLGSKAYASAHRREMSDVQAVLVLDNGTGRITGMALQGRDALGDLWRSMFAPLATLGPFTVRPGIKTGTDHLSFLPYGVPAFNYDQATAGYDHTHHSQIDDYTHVIPADVAQAATVMAVNAWQLANLPELLPRKKD